MRVVTILVVCSAPLLGQGSTSRSTTRMQAAAAAIQSASLEKDVRFLASDAMFGRATPSPQLDSAAAYISAQLAQMRIRPFGASPGYRERFVFGVSDFASCSFAALRGATYRWPGDVHSDRRSPNDIGEVDVRGSLVYAQYGFVSKSRGLDPYAHVDVRGKIVIVTSQPRGALLFPRPPSTGTDDDLVPSARAAGERGAIAILNLALPGATDSTQDQWFGPMPRLRDSLRVAAAVAIAPWLPPLNKPDIPRFFISARLLDSLVANESASSSQLAGSKQNDLPPAFALNPATTLRIRHCGGAVREAHASNVVALIPGSDATLRDEYIVIGGHYDGQGLHLPPVNGDSINNSALDNATGAAGLLAIGRALAQGPPPRRSIILAWFAGEEMGIGLQFGSAYFVSHSPVSLSSIKLMINLDEIGPERENKGIVNVGYSAPPLREFVVANKNKCSATQLRPSANGQLGGGSDRNQFARKAIPYLAFEADGDDHSVTDEAQKIEYAAFADVARCVYRLTWSLANLPRLPLN